MGLDLGEKTIGVAVSDATRLIASPLELIRKSKFTLEADQLFKLMAHRKVSALVIGLPANMDGTEGPRAQSCRAFARNLERLRPVNIAFWDERLSTSAPRSWTAPPPPGSCRGRWTGCGIRRPGFDGADRRRPAGLSDDRPGLWAAKIRLPAR